MVSCHGLTNRDDSHYTQNDIAVKLKQDMKKDDDSVLFIAGWMGLITVVNV